jgi:hypothetical protein
MFGFHLSFSRLYYRVVCLSDRLFTGEETEVQIIFNLLLQLFPYAPENVGADFVGQAWILMATPVFWMGMLFIPITTLLADFVIKT